MKAIQRQRGELLGGDAGQALIREAEAWAASQSIQEPERMAAFVAPSMRSGS